MKKIKGLFLTIMVFSIITCVPLSAHAQSAEPTLEDYQAVAARVIDKYGMTEEMDYHLYLIPPDTTLEAYEEYVDALASQTAESYAIISVERLKTPQLSEESQEVSTGLRAATRSKRYGQAKNFAVEYQIHSFYTVTIASGRAYISDTDKALRDNITSSASIWGALPGIGAPKIFTQKSVQIFWQSGRSEYQAAVSGKLQSSWSGGIYDEGQIVLIAFFGKEELAYASRTGSFK